LAESGWAAAAPGFSRLRSADLVILSTESWPRRSALRGANGTGSAAGFPDAPDWASGRPGSPAPVASPAPPWSPSPRPPPHARRRAV